VESYSLGMKQKAKLATALVHDPELLFLDEPTNGLDPDGRREILELLADLVRKKNKSLILSSHILSDVESLCEHVVLIDSGRVVSEGEVKELTRETGRFYKVRVRGDVDNCRAALAAASLWEATLDNDTFQVFLEVERGTESVFRVVREAGCEVRSFEPQRRSLADVFLDAVSQEAEQEHMALDGEAH
jgi:ABC-2 type transport system ATP-binding protein